MKLTQALTEIRDRSSKAPIEILDQMNYAANLLKESDIIKNAVKIGDAIDDHIFKTKDNDLVNLFDYNKTKKIVITFYRGNWWPYCKLELDSYQALLEEFLIKDTQIIAICPEKPQALGKIYENRRLDYPVLSDQDNAFARKLGLVFKLEENLSELYKKWGINLKADQNNDWDELPLPVTLVLENFKVVDLFIDTDYTYRYDPEDLIRTL